MTKRRQPQCAQCGYRHLLGRCQLRRKPKFRVGQVVAIRDSAKSTIAVMNRIVWLEQVGRIIQRAGCCFFVQFGCLRQIFHQSNLRPLTKREAGG